MNDGNGHVPSVLGRVLQTVRCLQSGHALYGYLRHYAKTASDRPTYRNRGPSAYTRWFRLHRLDATQAVT